jgi:hypothetical protein
VAKCDEAQRSQFLHCRCNLFIFKSTILGQFKTTAGNNLKCLLMFLSEELQMVRLYLGQTPPTSSGKLVVEEYYPNCVDVFYIPPADKLEAAGLDSDKADQYKKKILFICGQHDFLIIFPLNTLLGHKDFLKKKYNKIKSITLVGFEYKTPRNTDDVLTLLDALPAGFIKDYDYGLGLQKDYRFLIDAVEEFEGIQHIIISKNEKTEIGEDNECTINFKEYDEIRKKINSVTNQARSAARQIKTIVAHNTLSMFLNLPRFPQKTYNHKNNSLHKLIAEPSGVADELSKSEQEIVINLVSKNTKSIAEKQPETLTKLHNEIELVTLERLIEKFSAMLKQKLSESRWQELFNDNPFILNLAFGYPIIKIQEQAHVGGRKISGSGDKITDFLVKNGISNNAALFEIKTPAADLLQKKPYRDGVFTPSSELTGAINQMLDQKNKFQREIAVIKDNSRNYNLESYAVHGVLVIGITPTEIDMQKSFELFRGNSKDISIITFDELYAKLKQLHIFLSAKDETHYDVPF